MTETEPSTMDHLTWVYCSLRDAWQTLSTDQACDEAAPWNQWMYASNGPFTEREILLQDAQLTAADAGKSVLHHLRLLARAYPPDALADDGLDPNGWPGFASYTLARAVLEGAAIITWLLQPDHDERCRRSARLQLWSACELRKGGLAPPAGQPGSVEAIQAIVEAIQAIVEAAGFEVREFGRPAEGGRDVGVVIDGQPRPNYTSEAVRTLLGSRGKTYYHGWSGTAHHAPWALMPGPRSVARTTTQGSTCPRTSSRTSTSSWLPTSRSWPGPRASPLATSTVEKPPISQDLRRHRHPPPHPDSRYPSGIGQTGRRSHALLTRAALPTTHCK